MDKWAYWISKLRYLVVAAWIAMASLSIFILPDLQTIVSHTEQKFLPAHAESVRATYLLQEINPSAQSLSNAVLVLSRKEGLLKSDQRWMQLLLSHMESRKSELGITSILSDQSHPELAERLHSKDGSTLIAIVNLPGADFEDRTHHTLNKLNDLLVTAPQGTLATLTGSAPLSQDFQRSSQEGLRTTELLTIGIVLIILVLVFRSPVTPIIPLLTIGLSLLISRGLIASAAEIGMPVSHFTESFLIAILFGAGTDYCILLILRYREELTAAGDNKRISALSRTMTGVGRTLLYSASTVFVAFIIIGFAQFGLYRSAIGVAIGMLITVAASLTLAPAMLMIFGEKAFWPRQKKAVSGAGESKLWAALAKLTSRRAGIVLVVAILLLAPITLLFQGKRSFNDITEISAASDSIIGFRQIERAFGSGELFPVTLAVTSKQSMRTRSGLAALEQASSELTRVDGVDEVRSAVRPLGRIPEELSVPGQINNNNNAGTIIRMILNQQHALAEGLKALAIAAPPLSQGTVGIWQSLRHFESGIRELLASQLAEVQRTSDSDKASDEVSNQPQSGSSKNGEDNAREQALNYYISPDGKATKFEVILSVNPYSTAAIDQVESITEKLRESLNSTALAAPEVFTTGVSAKYNELRDISYRDFVRTGMLVLLGIAIVLILLLRSIVAPLYILLSLGFNYLITMGVLEFLFVKILGYEGLSWTVSFFVFLINVALGVDYSIFLMARFKEEYRPGGNAPAMAKAMRTTGGIIGSAAIIMAGTFGALGFSGMITLVQIGVGTFIGLLLYATLFMALIVPAFSFLLREFNWWPFRRS